MGAAGAGRAAARKWRACDDTEVACRLQDWGGLRAPPGAL